MNNLLSYGSKYNQLKPTKPNLFDGIEFKKIAKDFYKVYLNLPNCKPKKAGNYSKKHLGLIVEKDETQFLRKYKSFAFNFELIHQTIYEIKYIRVDYKGVSIPEVGLYTDHQYYIAKEYLLANGTPIKFKNTEHQIACEIKYFSHSLIQAIEKVTVQLKLF